MKITHPTGPRRSIAGFTLIEMLFVISIISVLAALAIPAITGAFNSSRRALSQTTIKNLVLGIKNYQMEYNRYPVAGANRSETPVQTIEGSQLIDILLGDSDRSTQMNPRRQALIEPPMGKNGIGGLTGSEGSFGLRDAWGSPYHVVMDVNYDNKIRNPDAQNQDAKISHGAAQFLPYGAIVYSLGPDKAEGTKDDVVSWR
jgi:prepilin-type N-terminal cleavage/methylation domain-containing protein